MKEFSKLLHRTGNEAKLETKQSLARGFCLYKNDACNEADQHTG